MILNAHGSIFSSDADALVNPVNCVGHDGAGLAKQFRERYLGFHEAYRQAAFAGQIQRGKVFGYRLASRKQQWIIAFPTKQHWRDKAQYRDIEIGLEDLVRFMREHGIHSVAIPALGCGLGGLRWHRVKPIIEAALESLTNVNVFIYPPMGATVNVAGQETTD